MTLTPHTPACLGPRDVGWLTIAVTTPGGTDVALGGSMRLTPVIASLLLGGCGTQIRSTVINPPPHEMPSRPPASVEIFTSAPPRDRPFVDVAYLEAEQESGYSLDNTEQFFAKLRGRAAAMGCDGLVFGSPTNAVSVGIDLKTPMNKKGIVATCIVYTQFSPTRE